MDLVMELKERYGLTAESIQSIDVRTIDIHYLLEGHWPERRLDGPHSLPYLLAVAFLDGEVLDPQFEPQRREDPLVRYLFDRVEVAADPELTAKVPEELPARMTVTLKDGRKVQGYRPYPKGDPRDPLTNDELLAKFRRLAGAALEAGRLRPIEDWVWEADAQPSVRDLTGLLAV
jgi:2-methylcitrate dehydratase